MDAREKEAILQKLSFWKELNEEEQTLICRESQLHSYKKGALIHACNGQCLGLLITLSGQIRIALSSDEGREVTLFRLYPDDLCALAASCILKSITFDVKISAEADAELLIVPAPVLEKLSAQNLHVECFLYKLTAEHFSEVVWAMQQILFMNFDKRLAVFLYDEYVRSGSKQIQMTHEQIARNIASAREVVTRMLKRFAEEGIVSLQRGNVSLDDIPKLKQLTY